MTGDELRATREGLNDMSQAALAARLHVHPLTVLRWENNQVAIPETVALAIKQIVSEEK